jgi:hypothetical protein
MESLFVPTKVNESSVWFVPDISFSIPFFDISERMTKLTEGEAFRRLIVFTVCTRRLTTISKILVSVSNISVSLCYLLVGFISIIIHLP